MSTTEKSPFLNVGEARGFAVMSRKRLSEIASMGGKAAHAQGAAHEFTSDEAKKAGQKGGRKVSADRSHMAEIGRKGGMKVSADKKHMAEIGRKGGEVVSQNREHMAEIGSLGGQVARRSDSHTLV